MKRNLPAIIFFLLCALTCLNAATGTIEFRLKLNKVVAIDVLPYFTDNASNIISSYSMDPSKTIQEPQVRLGITTNATDAYNLTLTFSVMRGTQDPSKWGRYRAQIFKSDSTAIGTVDISTADPESITFAGTNAVNASSPIDDFFPIAFDFATYFGDYSQGNYEGTITVEVNPE